MGRQLAFLFSEFLVMQLNCLIRVHSNPDPIPLELVHVFQPCVLESIL